MIESELSVSGVARLIVSFMLMLVCGMIVYLFFVLAFINHSAIRNTLTVWQSILFLIWFFLMFLALIWNLVTYGWSVQIDTDAQTIRFRNYFTQLPKRYSFSDFNGYVTTTAYAVKTGEQYSLIYLLKNGLAEKVISGLMYDNVIEMKNGLEGIPDLGFVEDSKILWKRMLKKKPLLDNLPAKTEAGLPLS